MRRCDEDIALAECQRYSRPSDYGCALNRRAGPGMRRVGGRRTGGSGGAGDVAAKQYLYGLTNYTTANRYETQTGGGEAGVATGFGSATWMRLRTFSSTSATRVIFDRFIGGAAGHSLYTTGTNNVLTATMASGAGAAVNSNSYTFTATDVGKMFLVVVQHTGSALRLSVLRSSLADVAISGYTAAATPSAVGSRSSNTTVPNDSIDWFGTITWQGGPLSQAQLEALYDTTRSTMRLPTSIAGANVTHRWFPGDQLLGLNAQTGDVGPATIVDTSTGATADAMGRVGSPTVVRVDPSIDGRTAYGVQGASNANCLRTAGTVLGVASPFWVSWLGRIDAAATAGGVLLGKRAASGSTLGCDLYFSASGVLFEFLTSANVGVATSYSSVGNADYGQLAVYTAQWTGSVIRLFKNGIQVGSDVAAATFAPASDPFYVGNLIGSTSPSSTASWFGDAAGSGVPTAQQVYDHAQASLAAGRIQAITGLTSMLHDPTQDVVGSGDLTRVPATFKDRVGTDDLTAQGTRVSTQNNVSGVKFAGLTDHFQTAAGGGMPGVGTGFWKLDVIRIEYRPVGLVDQVRAVAGRRVVSASGYASQMQASNGQYAVNATDSGGTTRVAAVNTAAGDVGVIVPALLVHDGSTLTAYFRTNGRTASVACSGFTAAASAPFTIGPSSSDSYNTATVVDDSMSHFGFAGGHAVLTTGEINALLSADYSQGIVPTVAGKTGWRVQLIDEIATAGGKLPAKAIDKVTGESYLRVGSGLTLATRTERLFGYETAPIYQGINGASATAFYSVGGGIDDNPAAFGFAWVGTIDSQAVASAVRVLVGKRDATNPGFQLSTIGTNSAFQFTVGSSSTSATTSTSTIAASELGKEFFVGCWFDGQKAHMFVRRVEVGTGSSAIAYAQSAAAMTIGRRSDSLPADGTTFRGLITVVGSPSLAEWQALHDAVLGRETMINMPGREGVLIDATKSVVTAGGAAPGFLVDVNGGATAFIKNGAPTVNPSYTRAAA